MGLRCGMPRPVVRGGPGLRCSRSTDLIRRALVRRCDQAGGAGVHTPQRPDRSVL